jgi:hypothetical protein
VSADSPFDLQAAVDGLATELGQARLALHIERQKLITAEATIAELRKKLDEPLGVPLDVTGGSDVNHGTA